MLGNADNEQGSELAGAGSPGLSPTLLQLPQLCAGCRKDVLFELHKTSQKVIIIILMMMKKSSFQALTRFNFCFYLR